MLRAWKDFSANKNKTTKKEKGSVQEVIDLLMGSPKADERWKNMFLSHIYFPLNRLNL